jgi:membrane protease subunit (stomatin/prohibitin family)
MPFRRRRPLLRAAVVGGGAYAVGRSSANRSAQQAQQEQQAQQAQQAQQVPQQAPAAEDSMSDQLNKLTSLHGQGALTDAEFSAAKAKLLGNG